MSETVEHTFRRIHSFRDPVHGFIRVSAEERRVIDSMVFQRLRRIKQLGTSNYVYHGAEHTRFGHCLGVMSVATRMWEALRTKKPDLMPGGDEGVKCEQLLRLGALLHDVGHAPYSHASEELFPREPGTNKQYKHEDYTKEIILNSELGEIIEEEFRHLNITARDVVEVYSGDASSFGPAGIVLQDILAGELDADRLDYLARDCLYAGVSYGRYDLERLLDTVDVIQNDEGMHLAIEDGGRYALEEFLLSRYYMFLQVYLHEHRRFYDLALTRSIHLLLKKKGLDLYPSPSNWRDFVGLDDIWIQAALEGLANESPWADALYRRKHWKVVKELDFSDARVDPIAWNNTQRAVVNELGEEVVVMDNARAKTFQRTDPGPYITYQAEALERPKILVLMADGAHRVEEISPFINEISRRRLRIMRLYARPDKVNDVLSSWQKYSQN